MVWAAIITKIVQNDHTAAATPDGQKASRYCVREYMMQGVCVAPSNPVSPVLNTQRM